MAVRKIIEINEEKCDGCGLCVIDCAEGAIAIVDGKAKIVKDSYCDGLGACLGACPQDALKIIEREADDFDEEAAMAWVAERDAAKKATQQKQADPFAAPSHSGCGCQSSMAQKIEPVQAAVVDNGGPVAGPGHWPLKIRLVPPTAEYLKGAEVLVAADCAAAASPIFHKEFASGKVLLIGCPKFDDTQAYVQKLTEIIQTSGIKSIGVLRMEVPCCRGLSGALYEAVKRSGVDLEVEERIMTCAGAPVQKTLFG